MKTLFSENDEKHTDNRYPSYQDHYDTDESHGSFNADSDSSNDVTTDNDDSDEIWHSSVSSEYSWDVNELDGNEDFSHYKSTTFPRNARNEKNHSSSNINRSSSENLSVLRPSIDKVDNGSESFRHRLTVVNSADSISKLDRQTIDGQHSIDYGERDISCASDRNCKTNAINLSSGKNLPETTRQSSFRKRGSSNNTDVETFDGTLPSKKNLRAEKRLVGDEFKSSGMHTTGTNFASNTNGGAAIKHRRRKFGSKHSAKLSTTSTMKRIEQYFLARMYSVLATSTKLSVLFGRKVLHFAKSKQQHRTASLDSTYSPTYDVNKIYISSTASDSFDRISSKNSSDDGDKVEFRKNKVKKKKIAPYHFLSTRSCSIISTFLFLSAACVWMTAFLSKIFGTDVVSSKYGDIVLVSDPYMTVQQRTRARINTIKQHYHEEPITPENFEQTDGFFARLWDYVTFGSAGFKVRKKFKPNYAGKNNATKVDNESLAPGCQPGGAWQLNNHPYCNYFHETDLADVLYRAAASSMTSAGTDTKAISPTRPLLLGYLDSGLWRDVFAIDNPKFPQNRHSVNSEEDGINANDTPHYPPVVFKMMKSEHDFDARNFDRHRRDAVAMEQLTSSPHVVDLYGFCGNSVVTEFLPIPLSYVTLSSSAPTVTKKKKKHSIIRRSRRDNSTGDDEYEQVSFNYQKTIKKLPAPLTRETDVGRFQLFYGVAKALHAIHTIQGGPIVHADLQSKQFLISVNAQNMRRNERIRKAENSGKIYFDTNRTDDIDAKTRESFKRYPVIMIKMNDFNRCRFMATKAKSNETCPLHIPTAPGKARSPEEYAYESLSEKLDIYATGNILYEILAGKNPWQNYGTTETKRLIMKGVKPNFVAEKAISSLVSSESPPIGSIDQELFQLTLRTYERNPSQRISATELIDELEKIAKRYNIPILV